MRTNCPDGKAKSPSRLSDWKADFVIFVFCAATATAAPAQTFTTLLSFDGTDGSGPTGVLVQGIDGNLYGTTSGTVFKISLGGTLTVLHTFGSCAALVQATDGNFYGTTRGGGANGYGTIFKISPRGAVTTLHSFAVTDSVYPCAALVQASDGNFYGTTSYGGANNSCKPDSSGTEGCGTVFKIKPAGTLTTLHSFHLTDGGNPSARLVQPTDGKFYGTTPSG